MNLQHFEGLRVVQETTIYQSSIYVGEKWIQQRRRKIIWQPPILQP